MGFGGGYEMKLTALAQATTAGSTSVSGEVDMANFEGCVFVGVGGSTSTVAHTMTVNTAASTTATFVAVTGGTHATTGAAADLASVDVYKPRKRYLQGVFSTTAASEKFLLAIQYRSRTLQKSSTNMTVVVSPNT